MSKRELVITIQRKQVQTYRIALEESDTEQDARDNWANWIGECEPVAEYNCGDEVLSFRIEGKQ